MVILCVWMLLLNYRGGMNELSDSKTGSVILKGHLDRVYSFLAQCSFHHNSIAAHDVMLSCMVPGSVHGRVMLCIDLQKCFLLF